jgi:hypothetical protein
MSEPLDPIAAGVASVLKSLRTRAGLQEDRLAGTELALDTLTGLDRVRDLIAAGDTTERAIVRAVSAAVGTLEPTHSIVADVSLGLRLSADAMPGSDLYARDLGRRRTALLENWDRLHELRSAPSAGRAPAPRTLRLEIETAALSALAVALTDVGGRRPSSDPSAAVVAPGGRPPLQNEPVASDRSGEAPHPGAELVSSSRSPYPAEVDLARPGRNVGASAPPRLGRTRTPLLLEEFQRISRALRDSLVLDADGKGWPHDLRKGSKPPTALATSYGIKAMLLLEGFLAPDLIPVAERLRRSAFPGGGYAARAQVAPRPEVTAAVLDTLHRIAGTNNFDAQIAAMKNDLREFEKTRPFILTSILETSVQLGSDPDLTRSLIRDLLAARQPYGNLLLWPEKAEKNLVAPVPSIAHTARAVRALVQAQSAGQGTQIPEALDVEARHAADQAAAWLAEQQDLSNVGEVIDRQLAVGIEPVYVRHFTAAWVVKALVSVGLPTSHPSVSSAVAQVWNSYNINAALWTWNNGDLPVWMTLDAIDALRLAALAATIRSGGFDAP